MAALYCMENNLGLYLPAGTERLWWSAEHNGSKPGTALVWIDQATQDFKQMYFNAVIRHDDRPVLLVQRFAMSRIAEAADLPKMPG